LNTEEIRIEIAMPTLRLMRNVFTPLMLGLVILFIWVSMARADDPLDPAQVKAILRTETPEEGKFIERTVALVNRGKLPRDLFESCLLWARKKAHHKFEYFKFALKARASDAGIILR